MEGISVNDERFRSFVRNHLADMLDQQPPEKLIDLVIADLVENDGENDSFDDICKREVAYALHEWAK
jgi:hypothetical protein